MDRQNERNAGAILVIILATMQALTLYKSKITFSYQIKEHYKTLSNDSFSHNNKLFTVSLSHLVGFTMPLV